MVLDDVLVQDVLGHGVVSKLAHKDVVFKFFSEKVRHLFILELVKELIEKEEGLPDLNTEFNDDPNQRLVVSFEPKSDPFDIFPVLLMSDSLLLPGVDGLGDLLLNQHL